MFKTQLGIYNDIDITFKCMQVAGVFLLEFILFFNNKKNTHWMYRYNIMQTFILIF